MKIVTQSDKVLMNELYLKLKTYAAVSRETGFSPGTVKRYIDPNFVSQSNRNYIRYEGPLPPFVPEKLAAADFEKLCVLSEDEIKEVKALWEELDV